MRNKYAPLFTNSVMQSRIINCTAQIFAQAYKTRGIPGDQADVGLEASRRRF